MISLPKVSMDSVVVWPIMCCTHTSGSQLVIIKSYANYNAVKLYVAVCDALFAASIFSKCNCLSLTPAEINK